MRDEQTEPKANVDDGKTRTDGDRVIHTVAGTPYHGDRYERPRGLTTEQNEDHRTGTKIDGRHTAKPPAASTRARPGPARRASTPRSSAPTAPTR